MADLLSRKELKSFLFEQSPGCATVPVFRATTTFVFSTRAAKETDDEPNDKDEQNEWNET